jgi:hypothetical protein
MKKIWMTLLTGALLTGTIALADDVNKPEPKVTRRAENQQQRIAQGVKSGQLTARETANLEKKEVAIHQEVKTDRTLNGGKLTAAERRQVNRQQNQVSKQIYNKKHNAAQQH